MADTKRYPQEAEPRRVGGNRRRFILYVVLIMLFIGWRVQRHYAGIRARPDVFQLFEEYKQHHILAVPPTEGQVAVSALRRDLRNATTDENRLATINAFIDRHRESEDGHVISALVRLAGMRAALVDSFDPESFAWLLRQAGNSQLSQRARIRIIYSGIDLARTVRDPSERMQKLHDLALAFTGAEERMIKLHLTRITLEKASLNPDPDVVVGIHDQVIAELENLGDSVFLAQAMLAKAKILTPRDEQIRLVDTIIKRFGNDDNRRVRMQVLRALDYKIGLVEGDARKQVYEEIVARFGALRNHPRIGRVVTLAEEEIAKYGWKAE